MFCCESNFSPISRRNAGACDSFRYRFSVWRRVVTATLLIGLLLLFILPKYTVPRESEAAARKELPNGPHIKKTDKSLAKEKLQAAILLNGARSRTNTQAYCKMSECKRITCSSVPPTFHPGEITAAFVETILKPQCSHVRTLTLLYRSCQFPSNTLSNNWLQIDLPVEELTFDDCFLTEIEDEAFSRGIFKETKTLSLSSNKIRSLRRAVFGELGHLQQLSMQNNVIRHAEIDLLADVADTLEVLQLDEAIEDVDVLANITGESSLTKLQLLSIRGNSLAKLYPELFSGAINVRSLYVDRSKVKAVLPDTFRSPSKSLQLLALQDNHLTNLPDGLFDFVRESSREFRVFLANNPWHCDCDFRWIQQFVKYHVSVIGDAPSCRTPNSNAFLSFPRATFCNESTSQFPSTTEELEVSTSITDTPVYDENKINITCTVLTDSSWRYELSREFSFTNADYEFPSRFSHFFLTELNDGSILVNLPESKTDLTLLWFSNKVADPRTIEDIRKSIGCVRNARRSFRLLDVTWNTSYTVCLSKGESLSAFSPLNCLAITTKPSLENRAWLTMKEKTVVLPVFAFFVVVLCIKSALLTFFLIRRHPKLLRGSKRIVMVKKRGLEAMILPKNAKFNDSVSLVKTPTLDSKSLKEDGYVTPLPSLKVPSRKDSRTSRISFQSYGASYVSSIESNLLDPISCKLNRVNSEMEETEPPPPPPPLPPHPRRAVPSVSMIVDSINANNPGV